MNELTNFLGGNPWSYPQQRCSFLAKKLPYGVAEIENLPDPVQASMHFRVHRRVTSKLSVDMSSLYDRDLKNDRCHVISIL